MLVTHPDIQIRAQLLGAERAPLLIIDNVVADPGRLVRKASHHGFSRQGAMFPGVRAQAPFSYREFLQTLLQPLLQPYFGLEAGRFEFPMCHYSLVTTPPSQLKFLQKVPHIDSTDGSGLATVHYLFDGWGGTAFYRHRQTGFEYIDEARGRPYFQCLEQQSHQPDATGEGYINGDSALFEQIARVDGVFNRMLVYRRNSLHSGCIDNRQVPTADPLAGRLSINSFIDVVR
ncbi:DUF6445 family protein [Pseudoxanthomonas dokdonensis]|uniref:Uncharacterized protein n=1 Tax=Pseudoxanthomonas dokdonensis TaxID=344882 RepID=A0A0R0CK33_9GAMM|nr:DUF6445 family protein [Pseudoxanthomonas dokdonensis]KRG69670.1 hypothetical protein ABB29_09390 [Pseudoxanthomonas dokdonensis]